MRLLHPQEVTYRKRSRTDQAHLPLEDVNELGRFVYAPAAQETPDSGHAGIVPDLEGWSLYLVEILQDSLAYFGVPLHRAKHVADENLLVRPDTLLSEEYGSWRVEPYREGHSQKKGREQHEPDQGDRHIEYTLESPLGIVQPRVVDLQERQPHAFREYGTAPHQGESARHHPERHPAQPHRVYEIEEFLVGQTLSPDEDDATGLSAVQHFSYRREVRAASEVNLTGQGVGSGHVLHHPAQSRPAFVISDQKNRSLSETTAVDPTYGALVQEPDRAGAQQAEYGGRRYLPWPEVALGVDRRPYRHNPGPA